MHKQTIITLITFACLLETNVITHTQQVLEQPKNELTDIKINRYTTNEDFAFAMGLQLYLYGLPLYIMETTMHAMTNDPQLSIQESAPEGTFGHATKLATANEVMIVSPNNDTLYSSAWLDLTQESYVLHIPAIKDRYYSFALLDAWTNTIEILSNRTRGTTAGDYIIVGPNAGATPAHLKKIVSPTNLVWILGRILVYNEGDIENVTKLQNQCNLTPLGDYPTPKGEKPIHQKKLPRYPFHKKVPQDLHFFDRIGYYLENTPSKTDDQYLFAWLTYLPISNKGLDLTKLDPGTAAGLSRVKKVAEEIMNSFARDHSKVVNYWATLIIPYDYGNNYLLRATIAYKGMGALPPEEAIYFTSSRDIAGDRLTGNNCYHLHFNKGELPPANAFWSITMYSQKTLFLVENEINRFSIGDRTPGLHYNDDGSLDIYIQHKKPQKNISNWLPAPEKAFYLVLRLYNPKEAALNGTWKIPGIIHDSRKNSLS